MGVSATHHDTPPRSTRQGAVRAGPAGAPSPQEAGCPGATPSRRGGAPSWLRPVQPACPTPPARPRGTMCPTHGSPADGKERTGEKPRRAHLSSRKGREGSPGRKAKGAREGHEWQSALPRLPAYLLAHKAHTRLRPDTPGGPSPGDSRCRALSQPRTPAPCINFVPLGGTKQDSEAVGPCPRPHDDHRRLLSHSDPVQPGCVQSWNWCDQQA